MPKGMNEAEAYHKLYGSLINTIPFYCDRFNRVVTIRKGEEWAVVR